MYQNDVAMIIPRKKYAYIFSTVPCLSKNPRDTDLSSFSILSSSSFIVPYITGTSAMDIKNRKTIDAAVGNIMYADHIDIDVTIILYASISIGRFSISLFEMMDSRTILLIAFILLI